MSITTQEQSQLLDQLQNEVNRVLEQTGRVFVAAGDNPKAGPVVQVTKLKQILPGSIDRFQVALDQLEDELQTAKLVMCRDLALCRERAGIPKPQHANGIEIITEATTENDVDEKPVAPANEPEKAVPSEDVVMQDSQPDQPLETNQSVAEDSTAKNEPNDLLKEESIPEKQLADPNAQTQPEAADLDQNPSDPALQIDTQTHPADSKGETTQENEDIEPDTGTFSNTNDLESLFGAPTSAEAGDAPDFGIDPNNNTEFDFGSFGTNLDDHNNSADNDNISALLPGLQDYANTQPSGSGEPDFGALFSTDLPMASEDQGDGQQRDGLEHRDSTFDDLFDLSDFNAGDMGEGGGNENQDIDFSFD